MVVRHAFSNNPQMETLTTICPVFWKKTRLATFENWPFRGPDCACTPERMAAAGFIAIGGKNDPDLVECFICGKELDGWDPDDDPWDEHMRHMPSCGFVLMGKPDESSWTLPELYSLQKVYYRRQINKASDKAIAQLKNQCEDLAFLIPKTSKTVRKSRKRS